MEYAGIKVPAGRVQVKYGGRGDRVSFSIDVNTTGPFICMVRAFCLFVTVGAMCQTLASKKESES